MLYKLKFVLYTVYRKEVAQINLRNLFQAGIDLETYVWKSWNLWIWQLKEGEIYDMGKMTSNCYVLDLDLVKFSYFG